MSGGINLVLHSFQKCCQCHSQVQFASGEKSCFPGGQIATSAEWLPIIILLFWEPLLALYWRQSVCLPGLGIADNKDSVDSECGLLEQGKKNKTWLRFRVPTSSYCCFEFWRVRWLQFQLSSIYSASSVMMLMTRALTGQEKSESRDWIGQRNSPRGSQEVLLPELKNNLCFTLYLLEPTKFIGYKRGRIMPK